MKTRHTQFALLLTFCFQISASLAAAPLGTAFTYQGKLTDGASAATGNYDLKFALYDAATSGSVVAGPVTQSAVAVSNGLFAVTLDFGAGAFAGAGRWLEVGVRSSGAGGDFTSLTPRQALTPAPYALYTPSAGAATTATTATAVPWTGLTGLPAGFADGADNDTLYTAGTGLSLSGGAFSLNTGYTDGRYWKLGGNAGTTPGTGFLGTTDEQPLELKVNGLRAFRLEPGTESPNLVAGFGGNSVTPGINGGVIGGGGSGEEPNVVMSRFGTVSGGVGNMISTDAGDTTIGGGWHNSIGASAAYATVGGGSHNVAAAVSATVAGGFGNQALGQDSVVGGGYTNLAASPGSTVSGGVENRVAAGHTGGFIGGGNRNYVAAYNSSIVGGFENSVELLVDGFMGGGFRNQIIANHTVIGGGLYNTNAGPGATIGGGNNNRVTAAANDAFIGGGINNRVEGWRSTIAGGERNNIRPAYSFVGAGLLNLIQTNSDYSTVAGGLNNRIGTNAAHSTIAGGTTNSIADNTLTATIAGGADNAIGTNSSHGTIGGGYNNGIAANSSAATIAGGYLNDIGTNSDYSAIGGGYNNNITTGAIEATIGGGRNNDIGDNGDYAVISGGYDNTIAPNTANATISGGRAALADHYGQWAYASGQFASGGDAQTCLYVLRGATSGQVTNELFLNGTSARLTLQTNSTVTFHIQVAARSDVGVAAGYEFRGVIERSAAGVTDFVGTVDATMTREDATALNFLVEANDTLDALVLKGVGAVSRFRWVATVRTTEVQW